MIHNTVVHVLARVVWGMVALALVIIFLLGSVVRAATIEDVSSLKQLLPGAHYKIKDTRTVYVWVAMSGQTAQCFIVRADVALSTLHTLGYPADRLVIYQPAGSLTEQACYAVVPP